MDFEIERENNIIKNIANEVVYECSQEGIEVTQELANYVVKLKMLNPKHGFTASKVMPRNLTQQLVELVCQDLKQDTPAMDCIRMQVYWNNVEMNTNELRTEYAAIMAEKAEFYLNEIAAADQEDILKMQKLLAQYILTHHNVKNVNNQTSIRETVGALHSIAKPPDISFLNDLKYEEKMEKLQTFARRVTGIRLYLKHIGKAGEGLEEVKELMNKIEMGREEIVEYTKKLSKKIDVLREVITIVIPMEFFRRSVVKTGEVNLPPECNEDDLLYMKKVLAIMLQHNIYLGDVVSKIEEIDATINTIFEEYENVLKRLKHTIRDREAVPTAEVYDDFDRVGNYWEAIQSYYYCYEVIYNIAKKLEVINQPKYFAPTKLEKIIGVSLASYGSKKSVESSKSVDPSSALVLENSEDFLLEFNGFCAWTFYYAEGLLVPGLPEAGIFQYLDKYYSFADARRKELWAENPQYFLKEIYEYLRVNPEMIELLNAYQSLYNIKTVKLIQDVDRKIPYQSESAQTDVHPIPEYWDKDYTFSLWELKKRALSLSRLVKCVTKSAQTVSPHSHYRASIGLLAAPDKDKEVQTKRDSSCCHPIVSNYLYGLRGHREDKFRVVELTRPVGETYERKIILGEEDPCRDRRRPPETRHMVCAQNESDETLCKRRDEFLGEYNGQF